MKKQTNNTAFMCESTKITKFSSPIVGGTDGERLCSRPRPRLPRTTFNREL